MPPAQVKAMQAVVHRLHERLPEVNLGRLELEVDEAYRQYSSSRVRDFVPILVEREVLERRVQVAGPGSGS
jgi:hypothetical protein